MEKMSLKQSQESENDQEKELSLEYKQELAGAWEFLVRDKINEKELEKMDNLELKRHLHESLIGEMEKIACDWGLWPKEEMVKKMVLETDAQKKTAMERLYLQELKSLVERIKVDFKRGPGNMWDSWPSRIKENKEFNCVGATLLGEAALRRAGLESYYGNPHGHVVNIVHLSDGEWYYLDLNNSMPLLKLEPEEVELAGTKALKIDTGRVDYQYIPLASIEDSAGSVLANFSFMLKQAKEAKAGDIDPEKQEALRYVEGSGKKFNSESLDEIWEKLYPDFIKVEETPEMKNEIKRLDIIHDFQDEANEYAQSLNLEAREELVKEIVRNYDGIVALVENGDNAVISDSSPELVQFLDIISASLNKYKDDDEAYSLLKKNVIDRMSRAKHANV